MSTYQNKKQKSLSQRFLFILGLLMFSFYLVLGLMFIFWKTMPVQLEYKFRMLFGGVLIVYAFIRFIRLMQARKDG